MENTLKNYYQLKIIPRTKHSISRKKISNNTLKVLYSLKKAGYEAYLVGGSIRDMLLGKQPKDFDITTNATPEKMRKLFRNCILVGRRFRLARIIFFSEIIEVATFRGNNFTFESNKNIKDTSIISKHGMLLQDNIFGSIEEDAQRRDFSINSIYYNIVDFSLRDYTEGIKDLQQGTIRLIGDPETRYREDPVRMLRAIRFAAKLNMTISYETEEPIFRLSILLNNVAPTRLFEETLKLLYGGYGKATYKLLRKYKIFQLIFPLIRNHITNSNESYIELIINKELCHIDQQLQKNIKVNPAFLFAAILWYPLLEDTKKLIFEKKISYSNAFFLSINNIINKQCHTLAIPKKIIFYIKEIWKLQLSMNYYSSKNNSNLIEHPKFYIDYDFLNLRAKVANNIEVQQLSKL